MKTVLMTFDPWAARDIINGDKTIDLRRFVPSCIVPNANKSLESAKILMYVKPEKHWLLYRCEKDGMMSDRGNRLDTHYNSRKINFEDNLCGSIIGEFTCEKVNVYGYDEHAGYPTPSYEGDKSFCDCGPGYWVTDEDLKRMYILDGPSAYECLLQYGKKKTLYGCEVKDPVLYEVARVLQFYGYDKPPRYWRLIEECS